MMFCRRERSIETREMSMKQYEQWYLVSIDRLNAKFKMQGRDLLSLTVPESGLTCSTSAKSSLSSTFPHRNYVVTVYDF